MSAALHLANADDLNALLPLVAAFHAEVGISSTPDHRHDAIMPLLQGAPYGAIYIIGPARAPIGYVVLSFGWSVEFGGLDCILDELYVRQGVRGRGIASEVLGKLAITLRSAGVRAINLEVHVEDAATQRLYSRALFEMRDGYHYMTRRL